MSTVQNHTAPGDSTPCPDSSSVVPPLCDEAEFAMLLDEMVTTSAPQLFAVVQEYGERVDAGVAAWGMAFDDHAEIVSTASRMRLTLRTPERALRFFQHDNSVRTKLIWLAPGTATAPLPVR